MNKPLLYKILFPLLLVLAIALGLLQRSEEKFNGNKPLTKAGASSGSLQDFYTESQQAAGQTGLRGDDTEQQTTTNFLAVGDIMLSRNVAAAIKQSGDINTPYSGMSDILKSTGFNFANLESPVAPKQPIIGGHSLIFGAASSSLQSLVDNNFQIINLANNHAFDQGLRGLDVTRTALDSLNIVHEGTGDNLDEAWTPAVVTSNGIKIGFIGASFSSINDGGKTTNDYVARIEDLANLKSAINNLKSRVDFVVVTMHAGIEYTRKPNQTQITFAHAAVDDGADMVIGAHPHWVQTIENYNGKYIFYSLGNFVFDQDWSQDTSEGLTLKITLSKNPNSANVGADNTINTVNPQSAGGQASPLQGSAATAKLDSIQLIPIIITNTTPRPATPEETKKILDKIGETETVLK